MKIKRNKFISNTIWLLLERVIYIFIYLIVGILSARYLGPENYGAINYTLSLVTFFNTICGLGLESVIIKELIEFPGEEGEILGSALVMKLITSTISVLIIMILLLILEPNNKLVFIIGFLQSLSLIFRAFDVINFWFQSKLQSKYIVISKSLASIFIGMWKLMLLYKGATVEWFAASTTIEVAIIGAMLLSLYYRNKGGKFKYSKIRAIKLINIGYHFILSGLLVSIYTQIDKIMLGKMMGQSVVGVYSVAVSISGMWSFIPVALINSARPIILEAKKNDKVLYEKRLRQLYASIIWGGIVVSLLITLLSKFIIQLLYGSQYIGATKPLIIIVWSSIFALLGTARGIWIVSEGMQKYTKYYVGIGAIVNVVLNLILVRYIGMNGTAIATLISQFIVAIIAPMFIRKTRVSTKIMIEAFLLKNIF